VDGVGIVTKTFNDKYYYLFMGPTYASPFMFGKSDLNMYLSVDTGECATLVLSLNNENINRPFKFKKQRYEFILDLPELNLDD
jgi:hypothetical protein